MAKATVTVAVIFLFFAVAHARFPLDVAVNKAVVATVDGDPMTVLPEPDFKTNLLLPSEKPGTEATPQSTAIVAWKPETAVAGHDSKSLTVISPRPANRSRFPKLPFSFPGSRCRKHRREVSRRVRGRKDTGNGKGLVLAEGREKSLSVFRDRPRQFPGRLMRLRNPGITNSMYYGKESNTRQHRNRKPNHQRRRAENHHRRAGGNKEIRHREQKHQRAHVHEQPQHDNELHEHVQKKPEAFVLKIRKFLMTSF